MQHSVESKRKNKPKKRNNNTTRSKGKLTIVDTKPIKKRVHHFRYKKMRLSDIELMVQALEIETVEKEEVIETTLDKAFPFLFG